jgi:threonine/homoserine/homoserine lactone efflux protein
MYLRGDLVGSSSVSVQQRISATVMVLYMEKPVASTLMFSVDSTLLLSFIWFALVMSFTPGPNCTIAFIAGTKFGLRSVLPHLIGVNIGFSLLVIATSLGAYGLISANLLFAQLLKAGGIIYLVWMGWNLGFRARKDLPVEDRGNLTGELKPTVLGSALFQFTNPKAWLFATGAIAAYQNLAKPFWINIALITFICACSCATGIMTWASLGTSLQSWLNRSEDGRGSRQALFNKVAGLSLILTALFLI